MKPIKHITLSIVLTLGVFCAVLYPSCQKDGCKGVTCLNGSTCSGGSCTCLPGIGGNNCETVYRELYNNNSYSGVATYSVNYFDSTTMRDTSYVLRIDTGNVLTFTVGPDSVYTQMQLIWNRPNGQSGVPMPNIILSNNTATGSTFTANGIADTFTYSGSGTVNATNASLQLVGTHTTGPSVTVTLNDLVKQ